MKRQPIYTFSNVTVNNDTISAQITFNEKHEIFKGHFPDNPIVPGVLQVQVVKDLTEQGLQRGLLLTNSKNIKFLNFISPVDNKNVSISINYQILDDNSIKVKASIFSQDVIYLKFSGSFRN